MTQERASMLEKIWAEQDKAYALMSEYDAMPHHYGGVVLYQAEAYIINLVGHHPGITVTELSAVLKKTPSACSQSVRKLRSKGFVEQSRNEANNRLYNLYLTERGEKLYQDHIQFNRQSQQITFQMLDHFTLEELECHLKVQQRLNEAYQGDILRSQQAFQNVF